MATRMRRILVIALAIGLTIIGAIIFTGVSARVAVWLGLGSYPIYFVLQTACSFLVLGLYNPAKKGFFKRLIDRLTRFNFERPWLAKLVAHGGKLFAILIVNTFAGPLVGAIFIKRLGYVGKSGHICAAIMNVLAVAFWNTIYLFGGIGEFLKKLI